MMGERTEMQEALFYNFRIEDHVPADHLLRSIALLRMSAIGATADGLLCVDILSAEYFSWWP